MISLVFLLIQHFFYRAVVARKRHAFVFLARLELRVSSAKRFHFAKGLCQTLQHILQCPRIRDIPMCVFIQLLEFRQVLGHFRIRQSLPVTAVIPHTEGEKMVTGNPYDIQVVMQVAQRLIMKKFMCRVSHGNSQYHNLNPVEVGGTDT